MTLPKILKISLAVTACLFIDYIFIFIFFKYHAPLNTCEKIQTNLERLAACSSTLESSARNFTSDINTAVFSLPSVGDTSLPLYGASDTAAVVYTPVSKTVEVSLFSSEQSSRRHENIKFNGIKNFSYSKIADLAVFDFSTGGRSFTSCVFVNTAFYEAGNKDRMLSR